MAYRPPFYHTQPPCRICSAGQRISTVVFAAFAIALALAAMDPNETPLTQAVLWGCAGLSGLAVLRFPIARLVERLMAKTARARRMQPHD